MTSQPSQQTVTIDTFPNNKRKATYNKIWTSNAIYQEKYFSSKTMQKIRQEDYVLDPFFKKKVI